MSPSPIARLKPYFKTRPKAGRPQPAATAPATAAQPTPAAPAAPQAGSAPPPAAAAPAAKPQQPAPVAPTADTVGLQARREQLADRYAELQSDLGGLVYEMAIRDHFRLDVVVRRAAELQAVDSELSSVEQRLGMATAAPATTTCQACGAAVQLGAQYCGRCGSSLAQSAAQPQPTPPPPHPAPGNAQPAPPQPTATPGNSQPAPATTPQTPPSGGPS